MTKQNGRGAGRNSSAITENDVLAARVRRIAIVGVLHSTVPRRRARRLIDAARKLEGRG